MNVRETDHVSYFVEMTGFTTLAQVVRPRPMRFYLRVGNAGSSPVYVGFASNVSTVGPRGFLISSNGPTFIDWKEADSGALLQSALYAAKTGGSTINLWIEEGFYVSGRPDNSGFSPYVPARRGNRNADAFAYSAVHDGGNAGSSSWRQLKSAVTDIVSARRRSSDV